MASRLRLAYSPTSVRLHAPELKRALGSTPKSMADLLGVSQSEASKLDRCSELDTGPLRKIIEAMGGGFLLAA